MVAEKHSPESDRKCKVCQATSEKRVLLCGVEQGRETWVCVRCLPMLIHGEH